VRQPAVSRIAVIWISALTLTPVVGGAWADAQLLPAPTGFSAVALSPSAIALSWDAVDGAHSYHVERFAGESWTPVADVNATNVTDAGLEANTSYTYHVCAWDGSACGVVSESASATTLPTPPPAAPASLVATRGSGSAYADVHLAWSAVEGATGYTLSRADAANETTLVYAGNATGFDDLALAGGAYVWSVAATSDAGTSAPTASSSLVVPAGPPVTDLRATGLTSTSLSLVWDAPQGAAGFLVNGTPVEAAQLDLADLVACGSYSFDVVARYEGGVSDPVTLRVALPGCMLWYDAASPANSATQLADLSAAGDDGALLNMAAGPANGTLAFDGVDDLVAGGALFHAPDSFTEAVRFRTTSASGILVSFQDSRDLAPSRFDRRLFLDGQGRVGFGVWADGAPDDPRVIRSDARFDDGQWHTAVATIGATGSDAGAMLYVDGTLVNQTPSNDKQVYDGYWVVGGSRNTYWESVLPQPMFRGEIAMVKVYDGIVPPAPAALGPATHLAVSRGPALGEASLSWWPAPGAERYAVNLTGPSFPNGTEVDAGPARTADFPDLLAGDYAFTVLSFQGDASAASEPVTGQPATAPGAPASVTATPVSPGVVRVAWSAPDDTGGVPVQHYEVSADGEPRTTTLGTTFGVNLAVPEDGAVHVFGVRANTSAAAGPEALANATAAWAPSPVASLWSEPGAEVGEVNLTWLAPATHAAPLAGYHVWRDGAIVATTNATRFVDANRTPGARSSYNVTAASDAGESAAGLTVTEVARPALVGCPTSTSVSVYACQQVPFGLYALPANASSPTSMRCDDCVSSPLALPFAFPMFGRLYTQVNVTTNGLLLFGSTDYGWSYSPVGIPTDGSPAGMIAGYWSDLDGRAIGNVRYATLGEAPHRLFVVSWERMGEYSCYYLPYCGPGNATFQVALHEDSGAVEYQIAFAAMDHHYATVGLEDETGTYGLTIFHGTAPLARQGFLLIPPNAPPVGAPTGVSVHATAPLTLDVNWTPPADATSSAVFGYRVYRDGTLIATPDGTSYADELSAPGNHTYQVAALNARGEGPSSAPVNGTAYQDVAPPTLTLDPEAPDGLGGVYNHTPAATAIPGGAPPNPSESPCDCVVREVASGPSVDVLDSFDGAAHASPYTVTGEGEHTLTARTLDANGNVVAQSEPRTLTLDTTAPTATVSTGAEGSALSVTFAFSEPMSPDATLAALAAPAGWTAALAKDARSLVVSGTGAPGAAYDVTLSSAATDAHGTPLAAPATGHVEGPAPPPPPPPPAPPAPRVPGAPGAPSVSFHDGRVDVAWSAPSDAGTSPVFRYTLLRNGQAISTQPGTSYQDAAVTPGATYAYSVAATNTQGTGPASGATSVTIPGAAPTSVLALSGAPQDGWYGASPTASFSATPADAQVSYQLDGGPAATYASPFAIPAGRHTLSWHATRPGSPDEAARSQTIDVDPDAPIIAGAGLSGSSVHARVTDALSGVASVAALLPDGTSVPLAASGDDYAGTLSPTAPGVHAISIIARDHAGHESRASAGTLTIAAPPAADNATTNGTATNATTSGPTPSSPTPPTGGGSGTSGGSSGGSGSGGAPLEQASVTPSSSTPAPGAPSPTPALTVTQDPNETAPLDAGARGQVRLHVSNVDDPSLVRLVVVDENGHETPLGSGTDATWDTTRSDDGYYTVEAREGNVTLASTRVLVRNAFLSGAEAAGGVALGVGAAALTSVASNALTSSALGAASATASSATSAASGAATSTGGSQGFSLSQYLKDLFTDAGSDALRDKTKNVASIERRRRIASSIALVATVSLIAVFYSVAESSAYTWRAFLGVLPLVGAAAVILALQKYGSESLIAHLSGARVRFRIWIAGVASLLVSTLAFHQPFGYPGYVDNGVETTEAEKRLAGHRALAILGITSAWSLVFVLAGHLGLYGFGSIGVAMAVSALATAAMPFGPLPGKEVWRWSKLASLAAAVGALALYVTYEMALLPEWALITVGLVGATGYAATAVSFRRREPPARSVPVQDMDAERRTKREAEREA
jgi:hypothetical protein